MSRVLLCSTPLSPVFLHTPCPLSSSAPLMLHPSCPLSPSASMPRVPPFPICPSHSVPCVPLSQFAPAPYPPLSPHSLPSPCLQDGGCTCPGDVSKAFGMLTAICFPIPLYVVIVFLLCRCWCRLRYAGGYVGRPRSEWGRGH